MLIATVQKLTTLPSLWTIIAAVACLWPLKYLLSRKSHPTQLPVLRPGWSLGLWSVSSYQYVTNSLSVLKQGYYKYYDKAYRLSRLGGNIIILPPSAVQELSSLPREIANGTEPLEQDLLGDWTGIDLIVQTRLHHRVVQRKLTPKLNLITPLLEEELNLAVDDLVPKKCSEDWTKVKLYPLLLDIIARVSARAFVGTGFCRDPEWLDVAVNYVEDLFRTVAVLRSFPKWMHPAIARLLPGYWRGRKYFNRGAKILGPYIQSCLDATVRCDLNNSATQEPCVLDWLVDIAEGDEANAERIAHTEILLSLAGIHTMLQRSLSVVYDLTEHRSYVPLLRDEIASVSAAGWSSRTSYAKLVKLDSFIRESQRLYPPSVLGMKRVMKQSYTLADGTVLPRGAYVCVDAFNIENDPAHTVDPHRFDGLRSYHLNAAESQESDDSGTGVPSSNRHSFASTELTVLAFGHGKTACPGRFFAGLVLKMTLVKLLCEYEFEFEPGRGRPANMTVHEFNFATPWGEVMMKKRPAEAEPVCPF